MSSILRKRQLPASYMTEHNKHLKTMKENIPPEICNTVNSHDNFCIQVTTPKKVRENRKEQPVTPSTNFKLLAALAADRDYAECVTPKDGTPDNQAVSESDLSDLSAGKVNRKEKSLGIICTRFLAMYPIHPPPNKKIIVSLDEACIKLGVERRRLYDIVNVFESIDILTKNAKNQYLWFGKNNLLKSLYQLKEAAIKENMLEKLQYVLETDVSGCKQSCILNDVKNFKKTFESPNSSVFSEQSSLQEVRKEKSLGIMSQKFLMLFLVSSNKIISLGVAAKVLNGFMQKNEKGAQIKTQVRRLYDIANVLSSIGLIQKETSYSQCIRKPSFRYIGPDLKDYKDDSSNLDNFISQSTVKTSKSRSLARHSSFQEICAVAEREHQKLNLIESHNSAPPFDSSLTSNKEKIKTSFENIQLHKDNDKKNIINTNNTESKPKVKIPVLIKPSYKFINIKKPSVNQAVPYVIINNLPAESSEVKYANSTYGNQTFLLINTITPSKDTRKEATESQQINKVPSPQTIVLSPEQRDAILQSLNISLSPEQIAAIHLDGASQSGSSDAPCNILKITNKNTPRLMENKNIMKSTLLKDIELNSNGGSTSVNNTRSNTPSSIRALDSPLSIPSGYVTPIPSVSSDISFVSNAEVNDILRKIEGQSSNGTFNSKGFSQESINAQKEAITNSTVLAYKNIEEEKLVNKSFPRNSSVNQVTQLISNDSCSSDSVNLEVSNIFKGKCLSETLIKPKPFLIDEKTLLSPIKIHNTQTQISVPSSLNTPPYITREAVFLFSTPPASYQTTKINDTSTLTTAVLTPFAQNK